MAKLRPLKEDQLLIRSTFQKAPIDFSFLPKTCQQIYTKSKYWLANPYNNNGRLREALYIWTRWVEMDVYLRHLLIWCENHVSQRQLNDLVKLIINFNQQTCDPCLTIEEIQLLFTYVQSHPAYLYQLNQFLYIQILPNLERMIHRHRDFLGFQLSK